MKFPGKHNALYLFHISACSLEKSFDDIDHLLKRTSKVLPIIAVIETRITKETFIMALKFVFLALSRMGTFVLT